MDVIFVRFDHGSTQIIVISRIEDRVHIGLVIELPLVHLVLDAVDLVQELVCSGDLLLNHHVGRFTLDLINLVLIDLEGDLIDEGAHHLLDVGDFAEFGNDSLVEHLRLVLLVQDFEPLLLDVVHHLLRFLDLFVELIEQILGG